MVHRPGQLRAAKNPRSDSNWQKRSTHSKNTHIAANVCSSARTSTRTFPNRTTRPLRAFKRCLTMLSLQNCAHPVRACDTAAKRHRSVHTGHAIMAHWRSRACALTALAAPLTRAMTASSPTAHG